MKHIFTETNGPTIKDLKFALRKSRGTINKMRASLNSDRVQRYSRDRDAIDTLSNELSSLQDLVRVVSLFVECEWCYDPLDRGLTHVQDLPDILSPMMASLIDRAFYSTKKELRWDMLKKFLEDKVLGPTRDGSNGVGVYSLTSRSRSMIDAYELVKNKVK